MKNYASKLLLFGEHIVIKGARALAIPYPAFSGKWRFGPEDPKLQQTLPAFSSYLRDENIKGVDFDLVAFDKDLANGLFFESNIPVGYGLGSSGALCAAVYDRYAKQPIKREDSAQLAQLQATLAQMEGFFHAASSGVDPLVCYLGSPLLIQGGRPPQTIPFTYSTAASPFFLIDTHISRQTGPFVSIFLQKYEKTDFQTQVNQILIPANEAAIDALLASDTDKLWASFQEISAFEYEHFSEMIPPSILPLWEEGLREEDFALKLCGAGGGGFMLGLAKNTEVMNRLRVGQAIIF